MKFFQYDIEFFEDCDWIRTFTYTVQGVAYDFTSCTLKGEFRETNGTLLVTASTANSKITWVDQDGGKFKIHITDTDLASVGGKSGKYDIILTDAAGNKLPLIEGNWTGVEIQTESP